ncbi:hypothetical protein [Halioxenophilus sp. WMMB6]|uniref:hypothetical protein n=1 Tax=Halioxenophilus sp. WMMB6 TaxID=3073815 RepID=UPI00295E90AB|nr:hypothetical protein [Halioxenophilus sp. WMMB6]
MSDPSKSRQDSTEKIIFSELKSVSDLLGGEHSQAATAGSEPGEQKQRQLEFSEFTQRALAELEALHRSLEKSQPSAPPSLFDKPQAKPLATASPGNNPQPAATGAPPLNNKAQNNQAQNSNARINNPSSSHPGKSRPFNHRPFKESPLTDSLFKEKPVTPANPSSQKSTAARGQSRTGKSAFRRGAKEIQTSLFDEHPSSKSGQSSTPPQPSTEQLESLVDSLVERYLPEIEQRLRMELKRLLGEP